MGAADCVASQLEGLNLNALKDAVVLLFKHSRACNGVEEPRTIPDLETLCPGLLKTVIATQNKPFKAALHFRDWYLAARSVVSLWELRLQGGHFFTPQLLEEHSDAGGTFTELVNRELKDTFLCHLAKLQCGEAVSACTSELNDLKTDLLSLQKKLKQRNSLNLFTELMAEKNDLLTRIQTLGEHLTEYLNALKSLELGIHLKKTTAEQKEEHSDRINEETLLLRLGNDWTWHNLHCLIERENQRFKERLPLYARRSEILRHIHSNQVLVLSGETGSGKSTQLVQYLVDAGFIKDGSSVVCTQPRRVAAMTLFDRVSDESKGCSMQDPLVGCLISPSLRTKQFPKIMFMTDHALLQLCLLDEMLRQFECILVDEAHERSLNTDLLLAMLKRCLTHRPNFKVIIMSATADAELLSTYFGSCIMYHVVGRSFPVQFTYLTDEEDEHLNIDYTQSGCGGHVLKVVQTVMSINSEQEKGDILAFLTSQADVEWACSQQYGSSALVLPLHGRLQGAEQQLVFKATPDGMRKIIFATNVAETSLTIPGIKFVVDCGLAKESCVDPKSGMNVLKVCQIDRSAATQRAGRAGRTQAGVCYRLYSKASFDAMAPQRMPEILRVHLGVALLKLTAVGVQNIESFDFIDSPDLEAISLAVENLRLLGAIAVKEGKTHLTPLGWQLVKLGVDPSLGFIVLKSLFEGFGREGLVMAGLLSCSGSIFFRAGTDDEKLRSDCLKMRFCHPHGDIFTLMSVYREWDTLPIPQRNRWCVQNSINAKSMRRCQDFIRELKCSLKTELQLDVPPFWMWSAIDTPENCSVILRKILLFSMPKNLAVFSGHEFTGYDVVTIGKQAFLHPSSSCLVFGHFPIWVVFGNLLCTSRQFLTSVTVVEPQWLLEVRICPPYDITALESRRMHKTTIPNLNRCLLSRLCGKHGMTTRLLTQKILQGGQQRCMLEADYDRGEFHICCTLDLMERAELLVKEAIEGEKRWLNSECIEKCIFPAVSGMSSPVMLFGAGAEIREMLMQGEYVTVEIFNVDPAIEEQDVCRLFNKCADGVATFHRDTLPGSSRKWGSMTFYSQKGAVEAVTLLHNTQLGKRQIEVKPLFTFNLHEGCRQIVPVVKATLLWPRRQVAGTAIVRCKDVWDQHTILTMCSGMLIGAYRIQCKPDRKNGLRGVFIVGLGPGITESEVGQAVQLASRCALEDVHLLRLPAKDQPDVDACREALEQEIRRFVRPTKFKALVIGSHSDYFNKAFVSFDECEHEGAARAIAHLQGGHLSVCKPWQTISCQNTFFSSVQCSAAIYSVLKEEISDLMTALKQQNEDAELTLTQRDGKGGCHIKIVAGSLRVVAGCKSAFERLIEGTLLGEGVEEADVRLMFTRDGLQMAKSVEMQTRTYIVCDKRNKVVRVFGPVERKNRALCRLAKNLSQLQEQKKSHEIELRGGARPPGLMREMVRKFGVELMKLGNGVSLRLDQRRHILHVFGSREDMVNVDKKVEEVAHSLRGSQCHSSLEAINSQDCSICLCEVDDKYCLVGCGHGFCRACVREQILTAVRHREGFPLTCAYPQCPQKLLLTDLEALVTAKEQDELRTASLCAYVALNKRKYKFCTTPDCPAVYRVTANESKLFHCGACGVRLCTRCDGDFHLGLTCQEYEEFKQDPDLSLKSWRRGKQHVKCCPTCGSTIEKVDGCNHVLCKCRTHLCWLCLCPFQSSEDCYSHLQNIHGGFV